MFTPEQRDHVRERILALAKADPRVTGGALTGSRSVGAEDEWSDVDLAFGITDGITHEAVLDDWTEVLTREMGALHSWDLRSGSSVYRVHLLPTGLQVDIAVTPQQKFGARGPTFELLFGATGEPEPVPRPTAEYQIGLGWLSVLHARSSIERGKLWKAEYWISTLRDQALILACLRLGESVSEARGFDRLPSALTKPLEEALVRSLDEAELRRALAAATSGFLRTLETLDPNLGARLKQTLEEVGASYNPSK